MSSSPLAKLVTVERVIGTEALSDNDIDTECCAYGQNCMGVC